MAENTVIPIYNDVLSQYWSSMRMHLPERCVTSSCFKTSFNNAGISRVVMYDFGVTG